MDRAFQDHGGRHSVAIEGAAAVLALLEAEGYVLGVATNDATRSAVVALEAIGLSRHLPHIYGYDAVRNTKPAADMVLAFSAAAGIAPADIVVIGDNRHDLVMARAAGAGLAVGVTSGTSRADDLATLADVILPSIRELPALLRQGRK
jgi:phosphoglycolate phosphatase